MRKFTHIITDPNAHDLNNFVYMVRGMISERNGGIEGFLKDGNPIDEIQRIYDSRGGYAASLIGNLEQNRSREIFDYNNIIRHVDTYWETGIIINPAEESIAVAWRGEVGSPRDRSHMKKWINRCDGAVLDPLVLLTETPRYMYNEVVVRGDARTKIVGVYYKGTDNREDGKSLRKFLRKTFNMKVPLVEIPKFLSVNGEEYGWKISQEFDEYIARKRNNNPPVAVTG